MSAGYAAVETGGTKCRVALFGDDLSIVDEHRVPTESDPAATLGACRSHLERWKPQAIGVAAFGPITVEGPDRGLIGATPKLGWPGVNLLEALDVGVPMMLDTDVGAAALAELDRGAGRDVASLCYVTVGTGVGGAYATREGSHHGHGHSEVGHIPVQRVPGDTFASICPYHDGCVEGLASGKALTERKNEQQPDSLSFVAEYLGQLVAVLTYTFAPYRIAFGGGAMLEPGLLDLVRSSAVAMLGGYSTAPGVVSADRYVSAAELGQDAGLVGAALLAVEASHA